MSKNIQRTLPAESQQEPQSVTCLGMTFDDDTTRRAYFLDQLKEKLKDANFRRRDGFPTGDDEDILRLSDPPYYTACPNPWIGEFIDSWSGGLSDTGEYHREPYAVDVNVGKSDPIYRAHSYHTKVPHLAIVPSILHYTNPGDVILDGFCGSGMTGIAARWCEVAPRTYKQQLESEWKSEGREPPRWGRRNVVLNDLSPAATFIAGNYNLPIDIEEFTTLSQRLLNELRSEFAWLYETRHSKSTQGQISFTVWSDVFACPDCANEFAFFDQSLDPDSNRVLDEFPCPHCGSTLDKKKLSLVFTSEYDKVVGSVREHPKRRAGHVKYKVGKKSHFKSPDAADLDVIERVGALPYPANAPTLAFPDMQMTRVGRMRTTKTTHVHDLFMPRSLHVLSQFFEKASEVDDISLRNALIMLAQHQFVNASIMNRYRPASSFGNSPLTGVFYVSSLIAEANVVDLLSGSVKRIARMAKTPWSAMGRDGVVVSTSSTTQLAGVEDEAIDYVFTDPPFGENIYYSDLNFLPESWHKVFTAPTQEAIVDRVKEKTLHDYQNLMKACFAEYWRVLKPGRWMTVVFHNSKNAVWNSIQEALQSAGFIVADVRMLDKKQGSFQQIVSGNTVKRDLIISAYKPTSEMEEKFGLKAGTEDGVWEFISSHLAQLPVCVVNHGKMEAVAERQSYLLYDRMVAFHVEREVLVPLSAAEFHAGVEQRFISRDNMFFLREQVAQYDKRRTKAEEIVQLELFVNNEATAIRWLKQQLQQKPQTYQELAPQFMKELSGWEKHEKTLELSDLLKENFLCYDDTGEVPSQIHGYLSSNFHDLRNLEKDARPLVNKARNRWYVPDPRKEADLEKIRHRALMREFDDYQQSKGRLTKVRTEALRAGFKECWQNEDYNVIVKMAERVRDKIIQEDPALLMYYDNALMRTEG